MKTFSFLTLNIIIISCATLSYGDNLREKPSKILAFLPTEGKSHFFGFKPLLQKLVARGHQVTLVSPFPLDNSTLPYRHVKVEQTLRDFNMLEIAKYVNMIFTPLQICWFGPFNSELTLNKTSVIDFIRNDKSSFDLVMFENFYHESFVALAHKYNAPVVQLLPFSVNPRVSQWQSNPYNPAYMPDLTSVFASNMTFVERTKNSLAAFFYTTVNKLLYLPRQRAVMDRYFAYPGHENRPDLTDILRNISLTLINSHPIVGSPQPLVPSYINVAGMHCVPPKELPEDLKEIMNSSNQGVVYFSLGSVVKSSSMPKETVALFLSELSKIEQTVLWKWESDELPQLPKNVIIRKWFPQNDILGHPNCQLFITHGGVHSTIESIYHGVPMLAIPVFGDQMGNSLRAQYRGFAAQVPYFELTQEALGSALYRLLNDPSYRKNAKKASAIFADNPLHPLDSAVYWIEYVLRYKGAAHLQTAANKLYWFQYLLLDVLLFLSLAVLLVLWITKKVVRFLFSRCFQRKVSVAKKDQ